MARSQSRFHDGAARLGRYFRGAATATACTPFGAGRLRQEPCAIFVHHSGASELSAAQRQSARPPQGELTPQLVARHFYRRALLAWWTGIHGGGPRSIESWSAPAAAGALKGLTAALLQPRRLQEHSDIAVCHGAVLQLRIGGVFEGSPQYSFCRRLTGSHAYRQHVYIAPASRSHCFQPVAAHKAAASRPQL